MNSAEKYALIVAGGSGNRMKSSIPKQFVEIAGLPVLIHTINAFTQAISSVHIVLTLPAEHFPTWESIIGQYHFDTPHVVIKGGTRRFYSVRNALEHVPDGCFVAIHDGVRPVVTPSLIRNGFKNALEYGSAIPCILPRESVRIMEGADHRPVPRDMIRIIQTPQVFRSELIKRAYQQDFRESFTDDATVLEAMGHPLYLMDGDPTNIKITFPEDLIVADAVLKRLTVDG